MEALAGPDPSRRRAAKTARQRGRSRDARSLSGAKGWSSWRRRCDHRSSTPRGDAVRRYPRSRSHESPAVPNERPRPWVRASKVGNHRGSARNLASKHAGCSPQEGRRCRRRTLVLLLQNDTSTDPRERSTRSSHRTPAPRSEKGSPAQRKGRPAQREKAKRSEGRPRAVKEAKRSEMAQRP